MTELEIAVAAWKADYEAAPLDRHPQVWAAHYEGDYQIGSVYGPTVDEVSLAFMLMSPFGLCTAITDTFIAVDRVRHVWFTRLSAKDRAVRITDWKVAYTFNPTVEITEAVKEWHGIESIRRMANMHAERRMGVLSSVSFAAAFGLSVALGEEHVSHR